MAVGIPATTRPYAIGGLGGQNPIQTMSSLVGMQNTLIQRQANLRAGDIMATSPDLDTAIQNMRKDPLSGYMLESMNQIRQQQLTEAEMGKIGAEAYRTRYETGFEAARNSILFGPNDINGSRAALAASEANLDPSVRNEVSGLFGDINESLYGGLDTAANPQAEFEKRRIQLLMASKMPAQEAFATGGMIPPVLRTDIPSPTGLTDPGMGIVGGFGGGALGLQQPGVSRADATEGATIPPVAAPGGTAALGGPSTFGGQPSGVLYPAPEGQSQQTTNITNESADVEKDIPGEMQKLNLMNEALHEFQAGGWAKERTHLASDAQGIKNMLDDMGLHWISQARVNEIAPKNLSEAQLFDQLLKPIMTQQLRNSVSGTGAGRIREEVTAFLNSADASKDPAMLIKMLNQVKFGMAVGLDRAESWPEYRRMLMAGDPSVRGMYPGDFYDWYRRSGKLDTINKQYGSNMDMSPYTTEGVLGAGREQPTYPDRAIRVEKGTGRVFEMQGGKWVRHRELEGQR